MELVQLHLNSDKVTAVQGDVSKLADLDRLYDQIRKEKSHLDILFANAAIFETASLETVTEKHVDDTLNINIKGLIFTVQKALPIFTNGGWIILNASVASFN